MSELMDTRTALAMIDPGGVLISAPYAPAVSPHEVHCYRRIDQDEWHVLVYPFTTPIPAVSTLALEQLLCGRMTYASPPDAWEDAREQIVGMIDAVLDAAGGQGMSA